VPNALANETSPYLRQHAENPVDWLPWGPQALTLARERDVPLLVSIGYSSCHWCHVMEGESFEDPATAALMNEEFVCVKVDREERPDIDALYMQALQSMTGHGGWPLNVFLTPEQLPFYGGTYFPPDPRPGMPAWTQVLQAIAEAWRERKAEIRAGGERLREHLAAAAALQPSSEPIQPAELDAAVMGLRESFDAVNGGFGGAPKFPQAPVLLFLLARTDTRSDSENEAESGNGRGTGGERESANGGERESKEARIALPRESKEARIALQRESKEARIALPRESKEARIALPRESEEARMALLTLRAMAGGGIHDQIGGGFHRYAVDATWTVPHFEKMLYDNALLARAYLQAHRLSGDPAFACVCRDTLDWLLRDMQGPEGGFYSALDADSLGVEGRYYVWTTSELEELLGEHADAAIRWFGATEEGNFIDPHHPHPGWNVLEDRGPRPTHSLCESIRARLLAAREQRARPGLDDKCLTSWNALAVAALADAGTGTALPPTGTTPPDTDPGPADVSIATGEPRYLQAAIRCAEFILRDLHDANGLLLRTYSHGQARLPAYLEDHAFLLEALLTLFEATCEDRWLDHARALADTLIDRFADPLHGGFFSTAADHEPLIARRKELEDSPIPSGTSAAALGLLRLARISGAHDYERHALGTLRLLHELAPRHPGAFGHLLQALQLYLFPAPAPACAVVPSPTNQP
jgi:uncharacterized protein YyaL (SSP411 family)